MQALLEKHQPELLQNLDVNTTLLGCLYQDGIISDEQKDKISSETDKKKKVQSLLDYLSNTRDPNASPYDRFIWLLREDGQTYLADLLSGEGDFDHQHRGVDDDMLLEIKVRKSYKEILNTITCDEVFLTHFVQKGVLNDSDVSMIEHEVTAANKVNILLGKLKARKAYKHLLDILDKNGLEFLRETIENTEVSDEDIQKQKGILSQL